MFCYMTHCFSDVFKAAFHQCVSGSKQWTQLGHRTTGKLLCFWSEPCQSCRPEHHSGLAWLTCLLPPPPPPPSSPPMLMKDMWWRHNAIVCQICLGIEGSGRDLAVVVWVDGQIICYGWRLNPIIASGSQEADSLYSCRPTGRPHRANLDLCVCQPAAVNSTGRLISGAHCAYLWTTVMMTDQLKSISHLSKRPLKDNYSIPLSI